MKVGILETGAPPGDLKDRFGSYGEMFQRLLGGAHSYLWVDVRQKGWPGATNQCDAYLITGSAAGVYDDEAWIADLKGFVQQQCGRRPLIGICFGHQLMAEALGGRVIKSPKGWGIGLQRYEVKHRAPWMDDLPAFAIPASHQDQVVELPPRAVVTAQSNFTAYAGLAYPQLKAISFQGHPEFPPEYAKALIELRRGRMYSQAQADEAIASLGEPNDSACVARWLNAFIESPAQ